MQTHHSSRSILSFSLARVVKNENDLQSIGFATEKKKNYASIVARIKEKDFVNPCSRLRFELYFKKAESSITCLTAFSRRIACFIVVLRGLPQRASSLIDFFSLGVLKKLHLMCWVIGWDYFALINKRSDKIATSSKSLNQTKPQSSVITTCLSIWQSVSIRILFFCTFLTQPWSFLYCAKCCNYVFCFYYFCCPSLSPSSSLRNLIMLWP